MLLQQYGWNTHFEHYYASFKAKGLQAGRVSAIQGFNHTLMTNRGTTDALLSGSILHTKESWNLPKVGDWVAFKDYDEQGIIIDTLPRQNELCRKLPGKASEKQVIAANIDTAFIIQGLDGNFNLMRLQRYIQQVSQCQIQPVIILNKKDLVNDPETFSQQVEDLGYSLPVVLTNALDRQTTNDWTEKYLQNGKTYILIGSSGVGKSTMLNALLGSRLQQEGQLSKVTNKGMHTTTARNLFLLQNGSMVIDTPGMREFGVTLDADSSATVHHPQIDELSNHCRFRDCTHGHEPGCAVIAAMKSGELPQAVYRSYQKLMREQYHFQTSSTDKKRTERQFGKMAKQVMAYRKIRKF